jgi:hypothetical protein
MTAGFALTVQRLPRSQDRVLVIGDLVGQRAGDGLFSAGDVKRAFEDLRVPPPGNASQELARLKTAGHVMRTAAGWSLTPEGRERVPALLGGLSSDDAVFDQKPSESAELADVAHPIIPPSFAPARFAPAVARLLEQHPFERNVFCMTRFPKENDGNADPVAATIATLRGTLSELGLTLHLASDRAADDELFGNVAAHMWACKYGVALLETRARADLNDNVLVEMGAMLVTGRRCALLKDVGTPPLPSDFVAHLYKELDLSDQSAVRSNITAWVQDDLGLRRGG